MWWCKKKQKFEKQHCAHIVFLNKLASHAQPVDVRRRKAVKHVTDTHTCFSTQHVWMPQAACIPGQLIDEIFTPSPDVNVTQCARDMSWWGSWCLLSTRLNPWKMKATLKFGGKVVQGVESFVHLLYVWRKWYLLRHRCSGVGFAGARQPYNLTCEDARWHATDLPLGHFDLCVKITSDN